MAEAPFSARVDAWRDGGEFVQVDGHSIYVQVRDGAGPAVVFLHGFPSSSYDWRFVADQLAGRRLVLFDFLGFGLSAKPADHIYSLNGQADLVEQLVARYCDGPVQLVAHDMGTSVANELMARDLDGGLPFVIERVLLFNGSMVIEKASLTPGQKILRTRFGSLFARLSSERTFRLQFARIFSSAHPLSSDEAADQWALLAHLGGSRILDRLIHYVGERTVFASRWHGAIADWPGPVELAWAARDPVCTEAVLAAVRELRPSAALVRMTELGHYPQLEDPEAVAAIMLDFLDKTG